MLDGNKLWTEKTSGLGSSYSISILKHKLIIYEMGDTQYQLRIDNFVFKVDLDLIPQKSKNSLFAPQDNHISKMPNGNTRWEQDDFGFPEKEISAHYKERKNAKAHEICFISEPGPDKKNFESPIEKSKESSNLTEKHTTQNELFNVFDMPNLNTLPLDLFSTPLSVSSENQKNFNPFEEASPNTETSKSINQPVINIEEDKKSDFFDLVDLDGLHLGDNYSPAFAKKIEEANKPIKINNSNIPNVPMQNLLAQRGMNTQSIPNMINPIGNLINMNPFMSGIMTGQFNAYYQNLSNNQR